MSKKLITLILIFIEVCYGNIVYSDGKDSNILFLGEYNIKNELKVLKKNQIVFIKESLLTQVNQITTKEYVQRLKLLKLEFRTTNALKLFDIQIFGNRLFIKHNDISRSTIFNIQFFFTENSWFNLAFQARDKSIYGFIEKNHLKRKGKRFFYMLYIVFEGRVMKTNLTIEKRGTKFNVN